MFGSGRFTEVTHYSVVPVMIFHEREAGRASDGRFIFIFFKLFDDCSQTVKFSHKAPAQSILKSYRIRGVKCVYLFFFKGKFHGLYPKLFAVYTL